MLPPRLMALNVPNRFMVVSPGTCLGRSWQVGEVVVCGAPAEDDDVIVLVARTEELTAAWRGAQAV